MNSLTSNCVLVVMTIALPIGGDISLLCAEDEPIDAVFKYLDVTFIVKKSNVWRYSKNYIGPDMVDGPIPLSKVFKNKTDLNSVDAVFHINAELSASDDPQWRTMCSLAVVFSKSKYHIFHVEPDGDFYSYYFYNFSLGVPLGLQVGSGPVKYFKDADQRSADAAFFNRMNSEAIVTAETDVFILSGFTAKEALKNQTKKPVKKRSANVFGVSGKLTAAMDISAVGSVVLLFGNDYCEVNISSPICRKKSVAKDWFRCDQIGENLGTVSETKTTTVTKPVAEGQEASINDNQKITTSSVTIKKKSVSSPKPKESNNKNKNNETIIIVIIAVAVVVVIIALIALLVVCVLKAVGKGSDPKSAKVIGSRASRSSKKTTFSAAFGPSK